MAIRELVPNADPKTIKGLGEEWTAFDQHSLPEAEFLSNNTFAFSLGKKSRHQAVGFDLGCGSGRWAKFVSSRVGTLHCIDASEAALAIARRNLQDRSNCKLHHASVDSIPLDDSTMDFGYSLGVLHHVPDALQGIRCCVAKLKRGAPLLIYLYYAFDNRPAWFRLLWRASDLLRRVICRMPLVLRKTSTDIIAGLSTGRLRKTTAILERIGLRRLAERLPLSAYRYRSFYSMRTDSLDRFGTRIEKRFTAAEVRQMMEQSGLEHIDISPTEPFWCAVGYRAQ